MTRCEYLSLIHICSSSMLVYNGEVQNVCASLYGSRPLPTAFIVTQPLDEGGN